MEFKRHKPTSDPLDELFELIRKGENQHLDFKHRIDDSRKIAKTLSAFANTEGGILLIGVKDNGKIAGIESDEELYILDAAANYYSKPKISYSVRLWQVKEKMVLEASIKKSELSPHFVKNEKNLWRAYARVADQNVILEPIIVRIMQMSKKRNNYKLQYGNNEYKVLSIINDKENIKYSQIIELSLLPSNVVGNILTTLTLLKVISYKITTTGALFSINENFDFYEYEKHRKQL